MSFMNNLMQMAGNLLEQNPQQAAQAASDHVAETDPNELADHLQQSVGNMDTSSLMGLGKELLAAFTTHPPAPDGDAAAAEAGTSEQAVASGDPSAVSSLIGYAKAHPEVLQNAAQAFMQRNPQALTQLAPGLLQGIMGRIQGQPQQ